MRLYKQMRGSSERLPRNDPIIIESNNDPRIMNKIDLLNVSKSLIIRRHLAKTKMAQQMQI